MLKRAALRSLVFEFVPLAPSSRPSYFHHTTLNEAFYDCLQSFMSVNAGSFKKDACGRPCSSARCYDAGVLRRAAESSNLRLTLHLDRLPSTTPPQLDLPSYLEDFYGW